MADKKEKLILPTKPIKAILKNPKDLIIFSKPKAGKTSLFASLEDCLIIDTEEGSDYVDAMKVKVSNINDIRELGQAIIEAGNPYKFIAIDTITKLEELCIPYAEEIYSKTPMGKNWNTDGKKKYGNILGLPNGGGYFFLRQAFDKVIAYIKSLAPHIILSGHVKDTILEKNGIEVNALDLDLTGKLKRITASNSDAIGYLFRKGNQNILSFKTKDEVSSGARPEHLRGKDIVISELQDDGSKSWKNEPAPLEQGIVDWPEVICELRKVGYDGWLFLEDFSISGDVENTVVNTLSWMKKLIADT